jgi:hypothetical protein
MFKQTKRLEITMENWYIGAVVYNLFSTNPALGELLDTCRCHLYANIQNQKKIIQGEVHNDNIGAILGFGPKSPI